MLSATAYTVNPFAQRTRSRYGDNRSNSVIGADVDTISVERVMLSTSFPSCACERNKNKAGHQRNSLSPYSSLRKRTSWPKLDATASPDDANIPYSAPRTLL